MDKLFQFMGQKSMKTYELFLEIQKMEAVLRLLLSVFSITVSYTKLRFANRTLGWKEKEIVVN